MELPSWLTLLRLPMPATLGSVNVYLIRGPGGAALIDTGMRDASSVKALVSQLEEQGLALSDIQTLVCTHHHGDHAGLGRTFAQAGARTLMSEWDATALKRFFNHPEVDETRASFSGTHPVPETFSRRISMMFPFFRKLAEPFEPTGHLQDRERLLLGGIPFQVVNTPGHTLGHVCLKHDDGFLFTGDCIIGGEATHVSMRQETIGQDPLGQFINSLEKIRDLGISNGLPGHGHPLEDLPARAEGVLAHHHRRLEQLEDALDNEPRTAFDLSITVMGERPRAFSRWLAMSQVIAYMEYLVCRGQAVQVEIENTVRYHRHP